MIPMLLGLLFFQCTFTKDANNNILLGPGCSASDIFMDAPNGDFRLRPGSPAINNAVCLTEVPTDIVGAPRPTPGRVPGCDVGAYQFPNVAAPRTPTNLKIRSIIP